MKPFPVIKTNSTAKAYVLCILAVIFASISCKKFVAIDPPNDQVISQTIFESDKTAMSTVAGLYSNMMQTTLTISNGAMSIIGGLAADEIYNSKSNTSQEVFGTNSIPDNNSIVNSNFWTNAYQRIYHVNAVLEGLANSTSITDTVKKQLTGEVKVVRAFFYFYLVNLFGDVPLITTTDYRISAVMPRTPTNLVYDLIESDLKEAKDLLKPTYPSAGRVRPNRYTAAALLSRLYLSKGDWANSESEATAVINSGMYSLVSNLNNVFLSTSNEAIWQLMPISTSTFTSEGQNFIPTSTTVVPNYALRPGLLNAFETGDARKINWLASNTVSGQTYFYPNKYKVRQCTSTCSAEYNTILRLAEIYLIRAEARAKQNNVTGAAADINIIRSRSSLAATVAIDMNSLLAAIEHERQIEMFAEYGNRWLDLKRTNRADAILGPLKNPNWQSTDALWPIPLTELKRNPYLLQNPGY